MRPQRLPRVVLAVVLLALVASTSGYVGARMGRHYAFNSLCCDMPKRHNILISVKETLGLLKFPSQIGQDRWVAEAVFPGVTNGYFLDVGSADGVENSNTWALEQRGWTGICVDPFPRNMAGRCCQMFKDAVDSVGGRHVRFKQAGDIGGITDYLATTKGASDAAPTVDLTTVTLAEILDRARAPAFIHYLSLDIEGAELEALRGFPFDRYRLGAIDVEHNSEEPKRSDIQKLLNSHGYVRARTWLQDDFYLPRQAR
jgi:FkbM family methyltransferase